MSARSIKIARKLKPAVFVLLLCPALWMLYQAIFAQQLLGADPAKELVDQSGSWAIKGILLALAMTPLRIVTDQTYWIIFRRMTGLFAFFYAACHFLIYSVLLLGLDLSLLTTELTKRPYIIVGFIALLCYIPLAITSTHGWQVRLKRNWARLHKLVYVIGILAVIHMTWLKKLGLTTTWPYALALVILLGIRIINWLQKKWHAKKVTHINKAL
ncbi:protein-methionine-sulfoxide reductase heme-binding subunit MsrQ [Aquirhabdus parva]|uniref:Protein-methionine-sulfoxide reductase heme-binding subunit MsrQ n=1 Tax=Aquirhabdus parva TaxID=2283318 RepID=A0A345P6Z7_9GAMM|nr:protein-methionine-sulfoxide reductase heme-binding subunit MsrQ [Aquirhabdus parva]AXI03056.1 sulfoxide reductase heme-binding subunit YedZ [Aquirhabdus parva]